MIQPEKCQSMAEVRAGVDAVDRLIVELLATRFRLMDAAARIKPTRDKVRDEERKAAVLEHVRMEAERAGAPSDLIVGLYDGLVEASIAYELERFDAR
jgi:isochorismate pyruvate lyase